MVGSEQGETYPFETPAREVLKDPLVNVMFVDPEPHIVIIDFHSQGREILA